MTALQAKLKMEEEKTKLKMEEEKTKLKMEEEKTKQLRLRLEHSRPGIVSQTAVIEYDAVGLKTKLVLMMKKMWCQGNNFTTASS